MNFLNSIGWLTHYSFALFRKKRLVKDVVYLDSEKLGMPENHQFSDKLNTIKIFLFSCYYQLKTPMTSLQATVQIINKMVNQETRITDKLISLADNAERNIKKLNHLVGDLLNSTKIEKGQLTLNKNTFVLSEVIDSCCSHIQLKGGQHIKLSGNHALRVTGDQLKIEQVMVNLLNNAVKYAPKSDEITIHVERADSVVKISVSDKGAGIPEESLTKLFDRYYRVDEKKRQISGLGLGLYISSEIVKRHGGEIGVISELRAGSTFWFILPDQV